MMSPGEREAFESGMAGYVHLLAVDSESMK